MTALSVVEVNINVDDVQIAEDGQHEQEGARVQCSAPTPNTIARAALYCPDVASLSGEVATYLPGRRVVGVAVRGDGEPMIEVHVVGRWGPPKKHIAKQARSAAHAIAPDVPLNVVIDDLDTGEVAGDR